MAPVYKKKTAAEIVKDIHKTTSVSASINVGSGALKDVEAISDKVSSPIMKKAAKSLPVVKNVKTPTKEMIKKVRKNAGVKQRSDGIKEADRMSKAGVKHLSRYQLAKLQREPAQELDEVQKQQQAAKLRTLDLSKLAFENADESADENLLKHYHKLKANFACLDTFEDSVIQARETVTEQNLESHIADEAQLRTLQDVRTFYELREALMANEYYSILPEEQMMSKSFFEMRTRLVELLNAKERDYNLIDYYQNLIRLKELGITDAESIQKRKESYIEKLNSREKADDRDPSDEMKKIADGFHEMQEMLNKRGSFYSDEEKKNYITQYFDIIKDDIEKFSMDAEMALGHVPGLMEAYQEYKDQAPEMIEEEETSGIVSEKVGGEAAKLEKRKEPLNGIEISAKQKEGMRKIQAFLLRRSCREKEKYGAFVHHFLQAPPEQQLTAFYLLENGKQEYAMGSDFYTALHDYTPDLGKFKERVRGRTFSLKWQAISNAVVAAKDMSKEMAAYAELEQNVTRADTEFRESVTAEDKKESYQEQGYKALDAIGYHLGMLELLYRNSGLHPDMSPDMVQDEKLRARMYEEYRKIGSLAAELEQISGKDKNFKSIQPERNIAGQGSELKVRNGMDVTTGVMVGIGVTAYINTYPNLAMGNIQKIAKATMNPKLLTFLANKDVAASGASFTAISSICTGILSFYGMYKLWNKAGLTSADKFAQWTQLAAGETVGMVSGAATVTNVLSLTGKIAPTSAGVIKTGVALGAIGVVASSAVMLSSGVQLGRTVSSGNDIKRAKAALTEKEENAIKSKKPITADDKKLKRFLTHQERDIKRQKASKSVAFVNSGIGVFSGVTALTGVLAPIAIVAGILSFVGGEIWNKIVDRKWRNNIINKAVDDQLGLDDIVKELKSRHKNKDRLAGMKDDDIRNMAREEALARFGYNNSRQYFRQVCKEFAEMLYRKVFVEKLDAAEKKMYRDALESLGMKIKEPKAGRKKDGPYPPASAILAKLMG